MLWRLPFCLMNRHRADRASVTFNGTRQVGRCRDCGKTVRKSGRGRYWKQLEIVDVPNTE